MVESGQKSEADNEEAVDDDRFMLDFDADENSQEQIDGDKDQKEKKDFFRIVNDSSSQAMLGILESDFHCFAAADFSDTSHGRRDSRRAFGKLFLAGTNIAFAEVLDDNGCFSAIDFADGNGNADFSVITIHDIGFVGWTVHPGSHRFFSFGKIHSEVFASVGVVVADLFEPFPRSDASGRIMGKVVIGQHVLGFEAGRVIQGSVVHKDRQTSGSSFFVGEFDDAVGSDSRKFGLARKSDKEQNRSKNFAK